MGLNDIMTNVATIMSEITVVDRDGNTHENEHAYKLFPSDGDAVPSGIWSAQELTLPEIERHLSRRQIEPIVHVQVHFSQTGREEAADMALRFLDQMVDKFDQESTLRSSVNSHRFRGGDPTIADLTFGGVTRPGIDVFLDCVLNEAKDFA